MRNYEAKLVDSSRIVADMLVEDIGTDTGRFLEMLELTIRDEYPLSMRAARIVALSAEKHPDLIRGHIGLILEKLPQLRIEGVKRGMLKIFAEDPPEFTEEQIGILTDLAFTWLSDSKQAMAVRYYCIEIILFVCSRYPELKKELALILRGMVNEESAGLRSRSRAVLKDFEKEGII